MSTWAWICLERMCIGTYSNHRCAQTTGTNLDAELPGWRPAHDDGITSEFEDIASVHLHGVRQQACSPFYEGQNSRVSIPRDEEHR